MQELFVGEVKYEEIKRRIFSDVCFRRAVDVNSTVQIFVSRDRKEEEELWKVLIFGIEVEILVFKKFRILGVEILDFKRLEYWE
ncbi:hypothetical protein CWI38_2391p0020 [Hamiltosporidium tvaerminnensis]|uniref:Uncharacterized protein n=1 Tax=Hamiltosporidium tvaerminnensis TaxID=1176355 RepID=A0A4Q9LHB2_9MICR|nr:hypothetical protein CWI38_2391p0020 [Hamiltosporidium tvaerminnensis]